MLSTRRQQEPAAGSGARGGNGVSTETRPWSAGGQSTSSAGVDSGEVADDEAGGEQPITLDRYFSQRRRQPSRAAWAQILTLLAMLIALAVVMIYKDRIGRGMARFIGSVSPSESVERPADAGPRD